MLRVLLITFAGLTASGSNVDIARKLQDVHRMERPGLRRRNAWDDMTNWVSGATNEVADFFSEDMIHWLDYGPVGQMGLWVEDAGATSWDFMSSNWSWDEVVKAMNKAAAWSQGAAGTVWDGITWFYVEFECMVESFDGVHCTECQEDYCNNHLLDHETVTEIWRTNEIMMMDMNDEWQPYFDGCASAMRHCPSQLDCAELSKLSRDVQRLVQETLDQCTYCYACLPYGSTETMCKNGLDSTFSLDCEHCTASEQGIYNAMYACSSLTQLHTDLDAIGKAYDPNYENELGTTTVVWSMADNYDEMCYNCAGCSKYNELDQICEDWETIKADWDFQAPEIPRELLL